MSKFLVICLVLVTFIADGSLGCKRFGSVTTTSSPDSTDQPGQPDNVYLCGICGQPITVDLIIRNQFQKPYFEYQVTVSAKPQRELIHFLESAATKDPNFKFSADFYGSLGYMITAINGVRMNATEKSYWKIHENPSGNSIDLGVSSYVPLNTQTIILNFTTWG
uniref:Transcobalamin-like C-terminal domain-containing protein n=1 Tax=Arion vulgaris TaxID=1028688 RepID=A0A0B7A697_9EUPU